jgi:hypothetical protein
LIEHIQSVFRIDQLPVYGFQPVSAIVHLSVLLYQIMVCYNCKTEKINPKSIKHMLGTWWHGNRIKIRDLELWPCLKYIINPGRSFYLCCFNHLIYETKFFIYFNSFVSRNGSVNSYVNSWIIFNVKRMCLFGFVSF